MPSVRWISPSGASPSAGEALATAPQYRRTTGAAPAWGEVLKLAFTFFFRDQQVLERVVEPARVLVQERGVVLERAVEPARVLVQDLALGQELALELGQVPERVQVPALAAVERRAGPPVAQIARMYAIPAILAVRLMVTVQFPSAEALMVLIIAARIVQGQKGHADLIKCVLGINVYRAPTN